MGDVATLLVPWDDIFAVLRMAAPSLGKYGGDEGGDTRKMLAMVRDDELIDRVAMRLREINTRYSVDTAKHYEALRTAQEKKSSAIRDLVADIKQH